MPETVCFSLGFFNILSLFSAIRMFGIKNPEIQKAILAGYLSYHDYSQLPNFGITSAKKCSLLERGAMRKLLVSRMIDTQNIHPTSRSRLFFRTLSRCFQYKVESRLSLSEILSPFSVRFTPMNLNTPIYANFGLLKDISKHVFENDFEQPEFADFLKNLQIVLRIKTLLLEKNPFLLFILDLHNIECSKNKYQEWRKMWYYVGNANDLRNYKQFMQEFFDVKIYFSYPSSEIQMMNNFFNEILKIGFQDFYTFCENYKEGDESFLERLFFLFESSKNPSMNRFFTLRLPPSSSIDRGIYDLAFGLINMLVEIPVDFAWLQFLRTGTSKCLVEHDVLPIRRNHDMTSKTCRFLLCFYELVLLVQSQNNHFFRYMLFLIHIQTAFSQNRNSDYSNLLEQREFFKRAQRRICSSKSFVEFDRMLILFNQYSTEKMNFDKFLIFLIRINQTGFLKLLVDEMNCLSQPNYYKLLKQTICFISGKSEQIYHRISDGFCPFDNSRCEACSSSISWGYSSD